MANYLPFLTRVCWMIMGYFLCSSFACLTWNIPWTSSFQGNEGCQRKSPTFSATLCWNPWSSGESESYLTCQLLFQNHIISSTFAADRIITNCTLLLQFSTRLPHSFMPSLKCHQVDRHPSRKNQDDEY